MTSWDEAVALRPGHLPRRASSWVITNAKHFYINIGTVLSQQKVAKISCYDGTDQTHWEKETQVSVSVRQKTGVFQVYTKHGGGNKALGGRHHAFLLCIIGIFLSCFIK